MLDRIIERFPEIDFLKADDFDDAIIGVDTKTYRLIYSVKKCIEILCKDMDYETACEYLEYNVTGAYLGDQTPIFCEDDF